MDPDCAFCAIVSGQDKAEVVYEDDDSVAFFPLEPAGLGHTLVVPRLHVPFLWDLDGATSSNVIRAVVNVSQALKSVLAPEGLNLINSSGEAASQTIFHLHMHLVPRWSNDHMGSIWPPTAHWSEAIEEETATAVRRYFTTQG